MAGYILRISRDEYEERIFRDRRYYVGVPRHWQRGLTVFFARRKEGVDSFIGHALIQSVEKVNTLPMDEREECERMGWRWKLTFGRSIRRYGSPVPVRGLLKGRYRPGSLLHGRKLEPDDVDWILRALLVYDEA